MGIILTYQFYFNSACVIMSHYDCSMNVQCIYDFKQTKLTWFNIDLYYYIMCIAKQMSNSHKLKWKLVKCGPNV